MIKALQPLAAAGAAVPDTPSPPNDFSYVIETKQDTFSNIR
jgi:hypothetical protein